MHKGILAAIFIAIMAVSVGVGLWLYHGMPQKPITPVLPTDSNISHTIHHEPYGDVLTTKETGDKEGVHYEVINQRVVPAHSATHQPAAQPRVIIQSTPHGKTVITEEQGTQGGANYHVIEKTHYQRLTPEQARQVTENILRQQHEIERQINEQFQQLEQVAPPIRFYQAPIHNRNH